MYKIFNHTHSSKFAIISGQNDPKSMALFSKTNQQVERFSEIIYMLGMKVILQCVMLPKIIVSYAIYFITDSGSDAFQLPIPLW